MKAKLKTMMAYEGSIFSSFFWCFVRMRLLAMLAQLNGCSPVGNESTQSNEVALSASGLLIRLGIGISFVGKVLSGP